MNHGTVGTVVPVSVITNTMRLFLFIKSYLGVDVPLANCKPEIKDGCVLMMNDFKRLIWFIY